MECRERRSNQQKAENRKQLAGKYVENEPSHTLINHSWICQQKNYNPADVSHRRLESV